MTSSRITVRIPAELRRRLKSAARRKGTQESELIRTAVERLFAAEEEQPSAYERLKKAGLIGTVKGAPSDLSTNRKHFDGFGGS